MDRREFVKTGVAASLATGVLAKADPPKRSRPNVLYVFSDQHRAVSLPGEPFSEVVAPTIDAFRRANFSMDACISNYPLCSPYRGILMTGKYPCQSGLVMNGLSMKTSEVTLTKTFKEAGYRTGYVGKWHLGNDGEGDESSGSEKNKDSHDGGFVPKGPGRFDIDDWHIWASTNNHYHSWTYDPDTGQKLTPPGWNATSMTDQALTFLKAQSADKPWLLIVSWNPPHPPFNPPGPDQTPYASPNLKKRPNVRMMAGETKKRLRALGDNDALHEAMEGYFGGITGVDAEFARILKTLEQTGQADNTIVIYTSDHGEMMGSQGRMAKQVPYEESCHVPFAVRHPGVTPKAGSSKALFAAIDIYPTLCGLAGVSVPPHCAGRDYSGIMKGQSVPEREEVFLMCGSGDSSQPRHSKKADDGLNAGLAPTYRGLRTAKYTYAVVESGRWMLYDNVSDPYQLNNLSKDPAHKELMASFDLKIKTWMKTTGDKFSYPKLS
jgi:arylsulfatase A-like enzyme